MLQKTLPSITELIKNKKNYIIEIFGEAASGKTTLAIQIATDYLWNEYNVIFVSTEIPLPIERFQQISGKSIQQYEKLELIQLSKFEQQIKFIDNLYDFVYKKPTIVIFDTITRLYRLKLRDEKTNYLLNRELNRQIALLKYYAREYNIKMILTNQVHANIQLKNETEPVAKNVVDFWADVILRTEKTDKIGKRKISVIKPTIDGTKEFLLELYHRGFQEIKEDFS